MQEKGSSIFHLEYENIHNDLLYYEIKDPSNNAFKKSRVITYHIHHEVVDINKDLNVALIRYHTSWRE